MLVLCILNKFSVQQLIVQRKKFQHKICYKANNEHLKLKSTPSWSIISRLSRDGKFLGIYKLSNKYFLNVILKNIHKLAPNNEFKNIFYQYQSFTDFNRVLFWRITSVNALFNLKKLKAKKLLYYLKPERRSVVVLSWLKYILTLKKKNYNNKSLSLFQPLINFICANKIVNETYQLKLKIYKLRVLRG